MLRWWPQIAQRYRRLGIANETVIEKALARARELAQEAPFDEPAAVFFAFAETRAAFPGARRLMAALLAQRQAMELGCELNATTEDLAALCLDVLHRRADFEGIRSRFETWLVPRQKA